MEYGTVSDFYLFLPKEVSGNGYYEIRFKRN